MYLLDSNIIIYILQDNSKIKKFLLELDQAQFFISAVSYLEVLIGATKEKISEKEIENYLDQFETLNMTVKTAKIACNLQKDSMKKMKFKDLIIAATCLEHSFTLITSDKDLKNINKIKSKIISLK